MFDKLLIANRGEIAVRIARTCRDMGIGAVAVFSDADAEALHVRSMDEAVRLPGVAPRDTYLRQDLLIEAAERTGADAVHPGYGFLAENPQFAQAVVDAGLVWVGPSPDAIAAMGDKLAAKAAMAGAGVPLLPSVEAGRDADLGTLAADIGFPVMVKAAAGGGGKGMRIVHGPAELEDAVAAARREAASAFGDDRVFLERFVTDPRHVEIQILGDTHGAVVHLRERECSIQRRHQKVVEESPSPALDVELRAAMGRAAVAAGQSIGYYNAGTVEFILGPDGDFHFLEVNTRLQVEHPVTESVVRVKGEPVDLVREQLRVAAGESLGFDQEDVTSEGHAIEARLYAEDPAGGYLPATGVLHPFRPTDDVPGVRWDAGVEDGSEISPHYDPMIAKVISVAGRRDEAASRLARALARTPIGGVRTNRDLLVAILHDDAFLAGETTTDYLDRHFAEPAARAKESGTGEGRAATAAILMHRAWSPNARFDGAPGVPAGFSSTLPVTERARFVVGGSEIEVGATRLRNGTWTLSWDDDPDGDGNHSGADPVPAVVHAWEPNAIDLEVDGHRRRVELYPSSGTHHVILPVGQLTLLEVPRYPQARASDIPGATLAPMPGSVVSVAVSEGDEVTTGDLLVVLEAMKMEHRITAPIDGVVASVRVSEGDQVDADAVLVVVQSADGDASLAPPGP